MSTWEDHEHPRFHRLKTACCTQEIIIFDLPAQAPGHLVRTALLNDWVLTRDGDWLCDKHRGDYR